MLVGTEATMITNAHIVTEDGQTSKAQATKIHLSTLIESDFVFIDESVNQLVLCEDRTRSSHPPHLLLHQQQGETNKAQ